MAIVIMSRYIRSIWFRCEWGFVEVVGSCIFCVQKCPNFIF